MTKRSLDDILADDDLIPLREEANGSVTSDMRVRQDFEEILRFVDDEGRLPQSPDATRGISSSTSERRLAIRLAKYRSKPEIVASLAQHDRHGVLQPPAEAAKEKLVSPASLDEILSGDDDILATEHDDIFDLRFVGAKKAEADWIANRVVCENFGAFRPLFDACAAELASGIRKSYRFVNEQDINAGDFFILNGVIVYVAEVNDPHIRYGRKDARLRCIYYNGTESELLLRSLARHLYKDDNGRRISNPEAGPLFSGEIKEGDVRSGCVYIAVSLSTDPAIRSMKNLHKLGVTTGKPERRVARANLDPTFLMAPARLVKSYTIYNADPAKIERILHSLLAPVSLAIDVRDRFGTPIKPREWFLVPLGALDEAIKRLMEGSIAAYRYDEIQQAVVLA